MHTPSPVDPFRQPDWRHQRCEGLLDLGRRPSRRRDDPATWAGWRYLSALRRGKIDGDRERSYRRYSVLHAAHRLRFHGDELVRWGVEGYLLAGVAPPKIDDRFRLPTGVGGAYAAQFFDVLGCLHARDYLLNVVIKLHSRPLSMKDADTHIRLFGLMGGRFVVDSLLDYYTTPVTPPLALDSVGGEERAQLLRRLQVHVVLLIHCLSEGGVPLPRIELLSRLADRLNSHRVPGLAGVQLDVSGYLDRIRPTASDGLNADASALSTAKDAA